MLAGEDMTKEAIVTWVRAFAADLERWNIAGLDDVEPGRV
jgi:hypothetical protein